MRGRPVGAHARSGRDPYLSQRDGKLPVSKLCAEEWQVFKAPHFDDPKLEWSISCGQDYRAVERAGSEAAPKYR